MPESSRQNFFGVESYINNKNAEHPLIGRHIVSLRETARLNIQYDYEAAFRIFSRSRLDLGRQPVILHDSVGSEHLLQKTYVHIIAHIVPDSFKNRISNMRLAD